MKTQLIKIGNSQGIRIPKSLVEQCNLKGELNIEVKENKLIIGAESNQRTGWDEEFKKAGSLKESALIDGDGMNLSEWDKNEWKW